MNKNVNKLQQKCAQFVEQNLRAPPLSLVHNWGKKLKLSSQQIEKVNKNMLIRHQLGKNLIKKMYFFNKFFLLFT